MSESTSEPRVLIRRDGAVAVITIDRPKQRNALDDVTLAELVAAVADADEDPGVRCLVIAGSEKVFASGADLASLQQRSVREAYGGDRVRLWQRLQRIGTPSIAAVSGFCLGGGCELALMCDLVFAAPNGRFGLPETQLGLLPGAGGTQMLPRAIGKAKAMDLVLTGRLLDAVEAERAGLISRVAEADVVAEATATAAVIAGRPGPAQQLARESVAAAFEVPLQAGIGVERKAFGMAFGSPDAREGIAAFLEKRDPVWEQDRG